MSTGTQVELEWTANDAAQGGSSAPPAVGANGAGGAPGAYLTDEEILGLEPLRAIAPSKHGVIPTEGRNPSSIDTPPPQDGYGAQSSAETQAIDGPMPEWMQAIAGDPKHGVEAQQLWQEHQAFRAAFSSPEEARAIKELFPGGASEAQALRQASRAVDQLDAAIYSGDARAQSEVVAELARANPAAFRSLFAEAAKVLAEMGQSQPVIQGNPTLRENREGWGARQTSIQQTVAQQTSGMGHPPSPDNGFGGPGPGTNHQSPVTNHAFDPAAYAAFERSTNDVVARDVRASVSDTLSRVLPEGVAEGAARRIGEDIFNEIHRTLAADRTLSEQVGEVLRGSPRDSTASGWRFGVAEQQRVASMLATRAKQLVPGIARRVIGEWTSSVLGTARSKAARQATSASRVDIAAPGGSLDSMPLRAMSSREVDYVSMSDDDILGM